MKSHILIVEDDVTLARVLRDNLAYEGFDVECAPDGEQALERVRAVRPALVLLDIAIPGVDGFDVCRLLNAGRDRLPIIMLTARTQRHDKVKALQLGADDYVTKPFSFDELLARIQAVLRRSYPTIHSCAIGDVTIDFGRMRALKRGAALPLTAREFAILQHLAERAGKVVTRDELLRAVWGCREPTLTRTVDNFVARLRRKIEPDPHHPRFIRTVHGDGYCLTVTAEP
jgi:two-component system response regulator VicR